MRNKLLALIFLLAFAVPLSADRNFQTAQAIITTSGTTATLSITGNKGTFEEVIAGTPSTVSIVLKGCMAGGTCDTLETNTGTSSSNRQPTIGGVYDYFTVTASWTGGTNVSITVNATVVIV